MSSTLERHAVAVGELLVGEGPAVVIGRRVSLRAHQGRVDAREALGERATLVEPFSAADLPIVAERADAVVVGAAWTRDIPLVQAVCGLGLPVVVERRASASMEEWLGLADYCAAEGDGRVILCEGGHPDLGLMRAARAASGRPVLVDVSRDVGLSAAAVAAGADGLIVDAGPRQESTIGTYEGAGVADPVRGAARAFVRAEDLADGLVAQLDVGRKADAEAARRIAEEAVTIVGALLRHEAPATLPECREAIDRVDAALATLLERRVELAGIVQRLKPVGGFAGRDAGRERALVAEMARRAPTLGEDLLAPVMNAVIEAGLHLAEQRARE
ncbi:chorismate mutase [Nonomuraea jiangxiensis]|uniref:Chorismate mutase type II n=1 Tax=Nonomuraea jiangxiensis TaxID=633440 RepID=A0A1G8HJ04_9ACTN|nr:Chorismate mutase type II [Nonomuraea jiangxiensis]